MHALLSGEIAQHVEQHKHLKQVAELAVHLTIGAEFVKPLMNSESIGEKQFFLTTWASAHAFFDVNVFVIAVSKS